MKKIFILSVLIPLITASEFKQFYLEYILIYKGHLRTIIFPPLHVQISPQDVANIQITEKNICPVSGVSTLLPTVCLLLQAFRRLLPKYYTTYIFTNTNIFWGFTSQNTKGSNIACWMSVIALSDCMESLVTPLSLIKRHDEGGALLNTLLKGEHEMWTLENGQTVTTNDGAIFTLSAFRKSVLLTLQCPILEWKLSWEKRGTSHAPGLMENRETSQWMKNIMRTRVQRGRTMERGRNTL